LLTWGIFILGAVALGALSIGHEYLHGTLSPWLALPVSRWQLAAAKLAALVPLLVSLAILATLGLVAANGVPQVAFGPLALSTIGLPLAYGLIVAPWLTMVARGPLGGVVFTLAVPLVVGAGASPATGRVRPPVFWTAMSVFAGIGAVLARAFMRLEALETHRDGAAGFAAWASGVWCARPLWALFTKELRLQQMTVLSRHCRSPRCSSGGATASRLTRTRSHVCTGRGALRAGADPPVRSQARKSDVSHARMAGAATDRDVEAVGGQSHGCRRTQYRC
jgi:hypothetical protein